MNDKDMQLVDGLRAGKPSRPKTYTVLITGSKFVPEKLKVNPGDKVTWTNEDIVPHTVTGKTFDSTSLDKRGAWTLVRSESGSVPYRCRFHPTMTGVLIVK